MERPFFKWISSGCLRLLPTLLKKVNFFYDFSSLRAQGRYPGFISVQAAKSFTVPDYMALVTLYKVIF